MKQFFFIMCCCLALTACGKRISTSNLPQSCQDLFKRWDELIVKMESNSNIPAFYVQYEKDDRAIMLNSAQKIEVSKKVRMCEYFKHSIDKKLQALASDPHGLDDHIQKIEKQNNYN